MEIERKRASVLTEALFYCLFSVGNNNFIRKIKIIKIGKDTLQGANNENWD